MYVRRATLNGLAVYVQRRRRCATVGISWTRGQTCVASLLEENIPQQPKVQIVKYSCTSKYLIWSSVLCAIIVSRLGGLGLFHVHVVLVYILVPSLIISQLKWLMARAKGAPCCPASKCTPCGLLQVRVHGVLLNSRVGSGWSLCSLVARALAVF